jgi:hypothetical protein
MRMRGMEYFKIIDGPEARLIMRNKVNIRNKQILCV